MKSELRKLGCIVVILCGIAWPVGQLYGQTNFQPIAWPGGVVGLGTTNGITYVTYQWVMVGCDEVLNAGPVVRNGNSFSYDFDVGLEEGVPCPQIAWFADKVVALGALAPGRYTLVTTSWGSPVSTFPFTMTFSMQAIGCDTNGYFRIRASSAVTNASYVLQGSTNLVNWTSISTNSVSTNSDGVVLTDSTPGPGFRYYRVFCP